MPDYKAGHAGRARYLALHNEGYADNAIDTWPLDGWVDDGFNRFEYRSETDEGDEEILCTVEFDDEFNATVTFADGATYDVNIREDEDPDDE
jgi:hypothetical protein